MLNRLLTGLFGSRNERVLKQLNKTVAQINALEPKLQALSDAELRARTDEFKRRLAEGATLDSILPEAFATVREASVRVLGLRHYDVQMIGGMVLHGGRIAEMRTGEGKTLVGTLPVYLNALEGKGVHVVTVNDYLARRDSAWMGRLYNFLGLSVGVVWPGMNHADKHQAYAADITYGTNNEFGFDYLRDNMAVQKEQRYQRGLHYAIVDEVDSILIDEARTPLIISGPSEESPQLYVKINRIVPRLTRQEKEDGEGDFWADEKQKQVHLSEEGMERAEQLLRQEGVIGADDSLYDARHLIVVHHLNAALRSHALYTRDVDYIVRDGEVIIVDEFTGRTLPGRRWSDGLHQAVEAKEGVPIQRENQTLATITFQNYFRMYKKLAGMTGTALTEAEEFGNIYGLEVTDIPTNLPVQRIDEDDEVYRTVEEKYRAIVQEIRDTHAKGQPVLVGTTSIEKSEYLAERLKKEGLKGFQVLNARHHEQEASIVAQAGVPGAITIATNMAGRGTDIQLGGNADMRIKVELADLPEGPEREAAETRIKDQVARLKEKALAAGGLYIIGTERHESRRIDNQLRGRSGRQGDPGHSRFFLSLQDDLMRIFGSERMDGMLQKLGLKEDEAIVHPWINRALEKAQQKVEARNFDIRKNILKYDNVLNDQRKEIFEHRRELMAQESVGETIADFRHLVIDDTVRAHVPENAYPEQWDTEGLHKSVNDVLSLDLPITDWAKEEGIADEELTHRITEAADKHAAERAAGFGEEVTRQVEKAVLLQTLDNLWRDHIVTLDHLRQVIGFRAMAQRDPLIEYKSEGYQLFSDLMNRWREDVTRTMFRLQVMQQPEEPALPQMFGQHIDPLTGEDEFAMPGSGFPPAQLSSPFPAADSPAQRIVAPEDRNPDDPSTCGRVGRNEACPCGSGKKYKHCHGAFESSEVV